VNERFRNLVYGLAFAIMVGYVLHIGKPIFLPIIAGIISVYILSTIASSLERVPIVGSLIPLWSRNVIALLLFIVFGLLLIFLFAENVQKIVELAPQYQATLLQFIGRLAIQLGINDEPSWDTIRNVFFGTINLQRLIGATMTSVGAFAGQIFVVLFYATFLIAERIHFSRKIRLAAGNREDAETAMDVVSTVNQRIGEYLTLKTLVNVMLGAVSYVAMWAIGLDFAGFFAVLIGVLNYIPYVGSFVGVAGPVLLAAAQFGNIPSLLFVFLTLTASQMFMGGIVEPRLFGRSLNLSPVVILISLTVWYAIWGIAGAILAVPLTSVVVIVLAAFDPTRPIAILLSSDGRIGKQLADPVNAKSGQVDLP
jgi:AI-2 transport protein TqsA